MRALLRIAEEALAEKVEIEFALTFAGPHGAGGSGGGAEPRPDAAARLGFLQTRPMAVADQEVTIAPAEMTGAGVLAVSRRVMGNGSQDTIRDIVYVRPSTFDIMRTRAIAAEIAVVNRGLLEAGRPYLLIGFGRWGSSEPTLGTPVEWGQISGARAVVEATLPAMDVEPSQGSHFFHNISSFRVAYFTIAHDEQPGIDWAWLEGQPAVAEGAFVRHLRLETPLLVKVDGRRRTGVIRRDGARGGTA